jgi:CRP-like cAMP-binding protein
VELTTFLMNRAKVSEDVAQNLGALFQKDSFRKGHELLPPNNSSKKLFFIESGLARTHYIKNTKDITHLFYFEDSFCAPVDSVFYSKPSPYALELLEPSVVRWAHYDSFQKFIDDNSMLQKFITYLLVDFIMMFSDRLYSMQFQSAIDRYRSMVEKHPQILLRVPLGMVASYLGVTQKTLSVIRAKKP